MDGYQRRTEQKKKQIKRVALELFTSIGVDKVTLAEIAKKANVSPVTLYNYFGTKEKLIRTVITDLLQEAWEERLRLIRSEMSFREKIERMIFDTAKYATLLNPEFLKEIMSDSPEMRDVIEEMTAAYMPEVIQFIESGKADGCIDDELSTESIMVYLNLMREVGYRILIFNEKEKNERLFKDLTRLFFYGLLAPGTK